MVQTYETGRKYKRAKRYADKQSPAYSFINDAELPTSEINTMLYNHTLKQLSLIMQMLT